MQSLFPAVSFDQRRHGHVFTRAEFWQQLVKLENKSDVAASEVGQLSFGEGEDVGLVVDHTAGVGVFE